MISITPKPPYYAVIFSTLRTTVDEGYMETTKRMEALAKQQEGYLGLETARNKIGITVSYWKSLDAILKWRKMLNIPWLEKKEKNCGIKNINCEFVK